jgi:NAD-dependent dihydropyrimidine dehydrogenase PreA subunit
MAGAVWPDLNLNTLHGGNIMAFVITDECLSCGSCAAQCPAEAIDMGELHYEIDQSKCLECGSCAAQCPAEAIENV